MNPTFRRRIKASRGTENMRLASLVFCLSTVGFAGTWSGYLVDSRCYADQQANVSEDATVASEDMKMDLGYCSPNTKTKKFAVVLNDWNSLKLDSAGNARAAGLVRQAHKGYGWEITVGGLRHKNTIKVASLSARAIKKPR
jgi:hypothetical protein